MGKVCGMLVITFSREHILCVNIQEYHLCCSLVYCSKIIHKMPEMMYVKLISYNTSPLTQCPCIHSFHSFSSLSYDRSKASSKRALHIVQSRASSFKWEYPLLSLRSSNSFLPFLPNPLCPNGKTMSQYFSALNDQMGEHYPAMPCHLWNFLHL